MTNKVRWGVLSTAKIGWEKVIPAMQKGQWCSIDAIASRELESAQTWAARLGIPTAYGSYSDLLADPGIEAIYNPLPNDLHVEWTLKAARAGKHVLCEKPFAMNANEAAQLREVAGQVHIMEAFMVRFHPQWQRAKAMVQNGELGDLKSVQVYFGYNNQDGGNIRNRLENGGGALYDIGCYAIVAGRFLFGCEPMRVLSLVDRDPAFKTDRLASALLDFGDGRRLDFTVSTQSAPYQRVQAIGSKKRLEIEIPFNAPLGGETRLLLDDGKVLGGAAAVVETLAACDQYTLQGDAFSRAVRGQIPLPYGLDDALCNMRIIDALFASEYSGGWETLVT
jgi:predicted dehydrogenase